MTTKVLLLWRVELLADAFKAGIRLMLETGDTPDTCTVRNPLRKPIRELSGERHREFRSTWWVVLPKVADEELESTRLYLQAAYGFDVGPNDVIDVVSKGSRTMFKQTHRSLLQ